MKENNGREAHRESERKIRETQGIFIELVSNLVETLYLYSSFYQQSYDTFEGTYKRILLLKNILENKNVFKLFYQNRKIRKESDIRLLFRLIWFVTPSDVDIDVNIDLDPLNYDETSKLSNGQMLVEFKLASNKKLKLSLENQIKKYGTKNFESIKVIIFFSLQEYYHVNRILRELNLKVGKNIVLIDAIPE